jgi:hypothetical protein
MPQAAEVQHVVLDLSSTPGLCVSHCCSIFKSYTLIYLERSVAVA